MVNDFNQAVFRTLNFENLAILNFSSLWLCFRRGLRCYIELRQLDYFYNCKSVKNEECLQCSGRSLSSSHENRPSPCQWSFWLVNFWAPERRSFERSNSYTAWKIQKIYVCPFFDECSWEADRLKSLVSIKVYMKWHFRQWFYWSLWCV